MSTDKAQWRALDKNMELWVHKGQENFLGNSANILHGLWLNSRLQ